MAQHMHTDVGIGQHHADRVDQERHVVIGDLDHRMRRFPAVLLERGVEDADRGLSRRARTRELQEATRQRGPGLRITDPEFIRAHA